MVAEALPDEAQSVPGAGLARGVADRLAQLDRLRQCARAWPSSPRCTLYQADPFSALALTSCMYGSSCAVSDSRSASLTTASASACRPWNSKRLPDDHVGARQPEVVAELGGTAPAPPPGSSCACAKSPSTSRTSRARAARAPGRTGRRTAGPPPARAGAAACRRASARTRCGRSTARRAAARRVRRIPARAARSMTLSSTWYSASQPGQRGRLAAERLRGHDAARGLPRSSSSPPGVEHPVRPVRGVQVVVEHAMDGLAPLAALAQCRLLGGVGPQQVVERVPAWRALDESAALVRSRSAARASASGTPARRRRGRRADVGPGVQPEQPEHPRGGLRQVPVGQREHGANVGGRVADVQRVEAARRAR